MWLDSDELDQPNLACNGNTQLCESDARPLFLPLTFVRLTSAHVTHATTDNFDAVAYESIVVGLFSIITGERCVPPRPFKRGGEQDAVYVGFSRDGFFNFQRSPVRARAFLPMSKTYHAWNFQNVQSTERWRRFPDGG